MPGKSSLDRVVVDLGNPVKGLLFGVLLIAGTMGSFFLLENYQDSADGKPAAIMDQGRQLTAFTKAALVQRF